jgi:hypothetical protein
MKEQEQEQQQQRIDAMRAEWARRGVNGYRVAEGSDHDPRYDYVTCLTCGERHQRIDFRALVHTDRCPRPIQPPLATAQADGDGRAG